jgi:hypothetical protein
VRSAIFNAGAAGVFVACAIAFQPAQPHFTDIAARSKFSYITNNDLSARKYFVQPMAGGVAIFDYDHDGKMEVAGAEENRARVLQSPAPQQRRRHIRGCDR